MAAPCLSRHYYFSILLSLSIFIVLGITKEAGCLLAKSEEGVPSVTENILAEAVKAPEFQFEDFVGDRILWPQRVSAQLRNLTVQLIFPPEHKLLNEAGPHVQLFTMDGKFNETFAIAGAVSQIKVGKRVNADVLYAKLDIYYCREGALPLCLIKNVLYEIPLVRNQDPEDMNIIYQIPY